MSDINALAAEQHVKRIIGPTIAMGDGSYFDFDDPESSTMTIEDFAYGLAYTCRFRGQTRHPRTGQRVFYSVAEHCVRIALQLEAQGFSRAVQYQGLMHEGGEPVLGDFPGPLKPQFPTFKALEKRCERAAHTRFGVEMTEADLIKRYDIRMLATEKRDLMPNARGEDWSWLDGFEPFAKVIAPWTPDLAAECFLSAYRRLQP